MDIDEDWALFLGYYMGDGSFADTMMSIACCALDIDVVSEVAGLISKFFGVPQSKLVGPNKGCMEVRITRKAFLEVFKQLGIIKLDGKANYDRHVRKITIPEVVFRSPRAVIRSFLSSLFEADGWVSRTGHKLTFFSKHIELCRQVQMLLLIFGIRSHIHQVIKKLGDRTYPGCELNLHAYDAVKFGHLIGFRSQRKKWALF